MRLCAEAKVYTNHKYDLLYCTQVQPFKLLFNPLGLCWCLLRKEHGRSFPSKKGCSNIVADTLSRVPASCLEPETSETYWNPLFI